MIGHDRDAVARHHVPLFAVACFAASLLLSGCTDFRRIVGMDRVGPDEFAVESRAPLTIPPEYDLRPPQPGAPRPQEGTAADKARKVIDTAGPGEPGKQATSGLRIPAGGAAGSGPQPDTSQQVGDQSLASKLLGANDSAAGGAVEKRETTTLKGVY
jgi:Protein of unknown function (DUF3035)